jgi:hypothetical protein
VKATDDTAGRKLERVLDNGQNPAAAAQQADQGDPAADQLLAQVRAAQASSWTSAPIN